MDALALERVYEAFQEFRGYFAPAFGRKQPRKRRIAENVAEAVPASPRAMQRFLTESP